MRTPTTNMPIAASTPATASPDFPGTFSALLTVWNDHQSLRSGGAPLAELFQSRAQLDATRLSAARVSTAR